RRDWRATALEAGSSRRAVHRFDRLSFRRRLVRRATCALFDDRLKLEGGPRRPRAVPPVGGPPSGGLSTNSGRGEHLGGRAEAGSRTDEVERRAAVAREVTRRGAEVAGPDRRDRSREPRLELRRVVAREQPRDGLVGSLEEYVCDLDRLGSCPERRERIDESLERV